MTVLRVQLLPHAASLPAYQSAGAAGFDIAATETHVLLPGERAALPTGMIVAVPPGLELQIRPRSGLALRHGVTVANAPGTVDADYRGEIVVLLINLGAAAFTVERGMRIAQGVLAPVLRAEIRAVDALDATPRGAGGFGSTGL